MSMHSRNRDMGNGYRPALSEHGAWTYGQPKGGRMNTSMKRLLQGGVVLLGLGWVVGGAEAYTVTDSILLNVAPNNAQYSVSIASTSATPGYDFGAINLAATTESTAAVVVT